jgi:hypothetical protein
MSSARAYVRGDQSADGAEPNGIGNEQRSPLPSASVDTQEVCTAARPVSPVPADDLPTASTSSIWPGSRSCPAACPSLEVLAPTASPPTARRQRPWAPATRSGNLIGLRAVAQRSAERNLP